MFAVAAQSGPFTPADTASSAEAVGTSALAKWIDDRPVLEDVSLHVPAGRFVALLGANGAGKSTLLQVLATLTAPTSGELRLFSMAVSGGGRAALAARRRIGMVAHQSMLYRDLSALENLVFFARLYGVRDPVDRAEALLDAVGLLDRADDPVRTFSRGMTQRVAIARALVHDPDLLLADEPFDGLDAPSTAALEKLLSDLHGQGKTLVLANHDIGQSLRLAAHAVVLRDGRVVIDDAAQGLNAAAVLREMGDKT